MSQSRQSSKDSVVIVKNTNSTQLMTALLSMDAFVSIPASTNTSPADLIEPQMTEPAVIASSSHSYLIEDFNQVTFGEKVGFGSYSSVLSCQYNGMQFAIKHISIKKQSLENCIRERDIWIELTNAGVKNVIALRGYWQTPASYYFISEYMPCHDLSFYIDNCEPIKWEHRYGLMKNIAEGVYMMHQHNIIHGDIKSGNLLVKPDWGVQFCDFGMSRRLSDKIPHKSGSLPWAAPEILLEQPITFASDVYSLALTFWEIAVWRLPYIDIENDQDVMLKVVRGEREEIPIEVPKKIAKLIRWGWREAANDRPTALNIFNELHGNIDDVSEQLSNMSI